MPLAPGTRLGNYEIVTLLGVGGMGEVYRARDTRLGRSVAIKMLSRESALSQEMVMRFEREALAASALNHPGIVTIHETGEWQERAYLVMELVPGEALSDLILKTPPGIRQALDIACQIVDGLAAAHEKGIVHRDLKPENVIVAPDGRVKLLDFGLAKVMRTEGRSASLLGERTVAGTILGTVGYMSPEQASGFEADFRSDIFSFGAVLYELLTGKRAFEGPTDVEILAAILRREPVSLSGVVPSLPAPARWIVERCLRKEPDQRYAATRDLLHDLVTLRDELRAGPSGSFTAAPRRRFGPATLALVAAGAAVAGAGAARLAMRGGGSPAGEPPSLRGLTFSGRDGEPAVSPDGQTVAFVSSRDGSQRLWMKQLRGGGEAALTAGPDSSPSFSPDGQTLFFTRQESPTRTSLFKVAAVGGDVRKLVDDAAQCALSPDGRTLAFVRTRTESGRVVSEVMLSAADGSGPRLLERFVPTAVLRPAFSPDGRMLSVVVGSAVGRPQAIHLLPLDGGPRRALSPPEILGPVLSVTWNRARDEVVYSQWERNVGNSRSRLLAQNWRTGQVRTLLVSLQLAHRIELLPRGGLVLDALTLKGSLVEVDLATRARRFLTGGACQDRQPVYSPDGRSLVFSSDRGGNVDVWSLSVPTGELKRLTDDPADDWDPAFTPDGKLLFSSRRTGAFEVFLAEADGTGPRQVTHDGVDAENPSATPDGWIAYANQVKGAIWKIRPDGTRAERIYEGTVGQVEVSPDGRYVLFPALVTGLSARIRVARIADGKPVPFEIALERRGDISAVGLGRSRWTPDGNGVAFVGVDEQGLTGIFVQDFEVNADTSATRRKLAGFSPDFTTESFGFSPDGKRIVLSAADHQQNLMIAENVPGVAGTESRKP